MASIVNVRLNDGRALPFTSEFSLQKGDKVVVLNDIFQEFGIVESVGEGDGENLGSVLRVATENDIDLNKRMLDFCEADKEKVLEQIQKLGIECKLVTVLRSLDNKKILVMYTANDRIDFRQLVKDLAGIFKMRVEMRQISERDEAKFYGGCGQCGQLLCCRRFLNIPRQTSIKMAKVQGMALTPSRVNGVCGKLMCCLQYEYSQYRDVLANMPTINSIVETKDGKGEVVFIDVLGEKVAVRLEDKTKAITKYQPDEITVLVRAESEEDIDE